MFFTLNHVRNRHTSSLEDVVSQEATLFHFFLGVSVCLGCWRAHAVPKVSHTHIASWMASHCFVLGPDAEH